MKDFTENKATKTDKFFMEQVIKLAKSMSLYPELVNEIPVAAILVKDDEIISEGFNRREYNKSVLAHAEIEAIEKACEKLNTWKLSGLSLYTNLEPCPMCAGAILQSHISKVVFGAYENKTGALGSRYQIRNKNLIVIGGLMENEAQKILEDFFKKIRMY